MCIRCEDAIHSSVWLCQDICYSSVIRVCVCVCVCEWFPNIQRVNLCHCPNKNWYYSAWSWYGVGINDGLHWKFSCSPTSSRWQELWVMGGSNEGYLLLQRHIGSGVRRCYGAQEWCDGGSNNYESQSEKERFEALFLIHQCVDSEIFEKIVQAESS